MFTDIRVSLHKANASIDSWEITCVYGCQESEETLYSSEITRTYGICAMLQTGPTKYTFHLKGDGRYSTGYRISLLCCQDF